MAKLKIMKRLSYKPTTEFEFEGAVFIVRPAESTEARVIIDRLLRPYVKKATTSPDKVTPSDVDAIAVSKCVNALVVDWKHMIDEETGKEVPFDKALLSDVLNSYPYLARQISDFCDDINNFKDLEMPDFEETAKNVETFTDGSTETVAE